MINNLKWKYLLIFIVLAGSIWLSYPLREKIHLGLDLQGGMHLVLEVQTEKAVEAVLNRTANDIMRKMEDNDFDFERITTTADNIIQITLFHADSRSEIQNIFRDYPFMVEREFDSKNLILNYQLESEEAKNIEENAVDQGLETIRNRVDEFGVAEPTIQRQGSRRILIQLPGITDTRRAKNLIGKTALLEFKLVDDENSVQNALAGNIPEGNEILYQRQVIKETGEETKTPF
ncbi:MAG: protein translocase subunit SecD, partial [Nitrospinota bacterium]|nr:protein translocase subunit SecD [Nitrospinota bacterium]